MSWIYDKLFRVKQSWIKLQRKTKAFNYSYADLWQIQEKLWDILEKERLFITHRVENNKVITEIIDLDAKEDERYNIESSIPLSEWIKAQDKGSEITYYRRYNLLSLLDLEVEDDDWAKASNKTEAKKEEDDKPWFNDKNYDTLYDLVGNWTIYTISDVRKKYKVSKANAEKLSLLWIK